MQIKLLWLLQNGDLYEGLLIGSDPLTDLAVLKVDAEKNYPPSPSIVSVFLMWVMLFFSHW